MTKAKDGWYPKVACDECGCEILLGEAWVVSSKRMATGYIISSEDWLYRCDKCEEDPANLRARVRTLERTLADLIRGLNSRGHD